MKTLTNKGLAEYAASKLGLPYWYGTQGQQAAETLYKQRRASYPSHYTPAREKRYQGHISKALQVFDCAGLIEAYINEHSNTKYDTTADGMLKSCKVSGRIDRMPDIPGILVHYSGHIGVYIGGGYVVEARGFDYGVCRTRLSSRPWIDWGKHPLIQYDADVDADAGAGKNTDKDTGKDTDIGADIGTNAGIVQDAEVLRPKAEDMLDLPILRKGSKGVLVRVLQKLLHAELVIDGDFGGNTYNAVRAFQQNRGLAADGIAGAKTWGELLK